jgi:pimeloyl-ACP methyl ester carboxylesterase
MRKLLLVAGLAAAALVPTLAFAQTSCEQQHNDQVAATVVGAGLGALVGAAVAPRHDRGAGALIGAGGGAVVANQATRPDRDCSHAYGYYDRDNQWHANAIDRADARGYYDRDGAWVDGAPNGHYDSRGVWVVGTGGADTYGDNASYQGAGRRDVDSREAWLERRIDTAVGDGSLSRYDARSDRQELSSIRRDEADMRQRHDGQLSPRGESRLQERLDTLSASLRQSLNGAGF